MDKPQGAEKQLEDIKRLLMLLLIKLGTNSDEIGLALNLNASRIRQIMPAAKIKKIITDKHEK